MMDVCEEENSSHQLVLVLAVLKLGQFSQTSHKIILQMMSSVGHHVLFSLHQASHFL